MKRKPAPSSVRADSVPRCLRHTGNPGYALGDAAALASFLQLATTSILAAGEEATDQDGYGLHLCFNLLRDKIDIAAGWLPFPTIEHDDDLPPLWTPPDGGTHDHE